MSSSESDSDDASSGYDGTPSPAKRITKEEAQRRRSMAVEGFGFGSEVLMEHERSCVRDIKEGFEEYGDVEDIKLVESGGGGTGKPLKYVGTIFVEFAGAQGECEECVKDAMADAESLE